MPEDESLVFNPFGDLIGLAIMNCEDGKSRCKLGAAEKLLNPHHVLHGAAIYAMADTGMGAALYTAMAAGEICATIEIKIVYTRPVTSGTLVCDSQLVHRGRKIALLESEIKNNGRLVAKATGTFYIGRRPESRS